MHMATSIAAGVRKAAALMLTLPTAQQPPALGAVPAAAAAMAPAAAAMLVTAALQRVCRWSVRHSWSVSMPVSMPLVTHLLGFY